MCVCGQLKTNNIDIKEIKARKKKRKKKRKKTMKNKKQNLIQNYLKLNHYFKLI